MCCIATDQSGGYSVIPRQTCPTVHMCAETRTRAQGQGPVALSHSQAGDLRTDARNRQRIAASAQAAAPQSLDMLMLCADQQDPHAEPASKQSGRGIAATCHAHDADDAAASSEGAYDAMPKTPCLSAASFDKAVSPLQSAAASLSPQLPHTTAQPFRHNSVVGAADTPQVLANHVSPEAAQRCSGHVTDVAVAHAAAGQHGRQKPRPALGRGDLGRRRRAVLAHLLQPTDQRAQAGSHLGCTEAAKVQFHSEHAPKGNSLAASGNEGGESKQPKSSEAAESFIPLADVQLERAGGCCGHTDGAASQDWNGTWSLAASLGSPLTARSLDADIE